MQSVTWRKNAAVDRCGYPIFTPFVDYGLHQAQKIALGKEKVVDYFVTYTGLDATGMYLTTDDLRYLATQTLECILTNPAKIEQIHREAYTYNDQYFSLAEAIHRESLSQLSNLELGDRYLRLIEAYERGHQHALLTTWFVDADGQDFSLYLQRILAEVVKQSGKEYDVAALFSTLTTKPALSLQLQEECALLEIGSKIAPDAAVRVPDHFPAPLREQIEQHYQTWRWQVFDYLGPAADINYYLQRLTNLIQGGVDCRAELRRLRERPRQIRREQSRLINELNLPPDVVRLFAIAADIVSLKGYRKDCTFHGSYVLDQVVTELARRLSLAKKQVYMLSYKEVPELMKPGAVVPTALLNERLRFSILVHSFQGYAILSGAEARRFWAERSDSIEKTPEINLDQKEFKGSCACAGRAQGAAKLISHPEQMDKMQQGDILVARTTFPSLVPAMKKASAIVTEDGGITCHAAIVARELGIPCLTGVRHATQVFQDGDILEVDAGAGVVRRVVI